jgi:hypothetical protein
LQEVFQGLSFGDDVEAGGGDMRFQSGSPQGLIVDKPDGGATGGAGWICHGGLSVQG